MRPARLIGLAVVALALGAFIFFFERKQPTTDERKEQTDKVFAGFDQAKAKSVVVNSSKGRFELAKEGESWKLRSPLADDANTSAVSGVLSALAALKSERTLEAKDVKLADYGLDKPGIAVTVTDEAGKTFTLKLGNEMPLGNNRPATTDGSKVFMVAKWTATDLEKDLAGWRSDQLAQVYAADVAALNLTLPGSSMAIAHTGNVWSMTAPVLDLADRDRAEGVVSDISGARIKQFLDAPGDLAALGLAAPRATVTLVRRGEKAAPIQLAFGNEREMDKEGGKQVACKRGERVFWVEAKAAEKLTGAPLDWRAKKLVQLDSWAADKLEIEAGGSKLALERKDGAWKNGAIEVDQTPVNNRLNALADLTVNAFDRPKPAGSPLGHLKVTAGAGAVSDVTLYPGASDSEAVAVVVGRAGALAVDGAKVKTLFVDPLALGKPLPTPTPLPTAAPTPKGGAPKPTEAAPAAVQPTSLPN
jgi:hypothetical protein